MVAQINYWVSVIRQVIFQKEKMCSGTSQVLHVSKAFDATLFGKLLAMLAQAGIRRVITKWVRTWQETAERGPVIASGEVAQWFRG